MSVITSRTIHIDNFPMQIAKLTFQKTGDSVSNVLTVRGISPEETISRHVLIKGWINTDCYLNNEKIAVEFSEPPYIAKLRYGIIVSPNGTIDMDTVVTTATEDDSCMYCIHPVTQRDVINNSMNDAVRHKIWRIPANAAFHFTTGRYYFCNVDLEINGQIKNALEPIACVYREVDVIPKQDAAIAEFWVEKVYISK